LGHWIDLNDWARTFSAHGAADYEFSLLLQTTCGFVLLHQGCVLSCCTGRRGQQRARGHVASPNVPNPKMHVTTTFLNAPNDNLGPPAEANIIH
jgi:hypothetical protein